MDEVVVGGVDKFFVILMVRYSVSAVIPECASWPAVVSVVKGIVEVSVCDFNDELWLLVDGSKLVSVGLTAELVVVVD